MKFFPHKPFPLASSGLTLVEMLIATGIGAIMMTIILALTSYAERSFAVTSSHVALESQSRLALDKLSREFHQATAVTASETNLPVKSITLTNAIDATSTVLSWDSDFRTLTLQTIGSTAEDNRAETLLRNCDRWDFTLCARAPRFSATDVSFDAAADPADCKLVMLSWSCSQKIIGNLETENMQEAQITLRNKVN